MSTPLPDSACCATCGYSLCGLADQRCPECGRPFDSACPDSYRDDTRTVDLYPPRPLSPVSELWLCVIGVYTLAVVCIRATPFGAVPNAEFAEAIPCASSFGLIVFADYLVRRLRLTALLCRDDYSGLLEAFFAKWRNWRINQFLVVVLAVTILWPWPAALRFYVSWPFLERRANQYDSGLSVGSRSEWVGLYRVEHIWGRGQGFVFLQELWSGGDRLGVIRERGSGYPPPNCARRIWVAPGWYLARW